MKRTLCILCLLCMLFCSVSVRAEEPKADEPASDLTFTIVWVPDTQRLVYQEISHPQLTAIMDWTRENAQEKNILCMLQTGDFADNMYKEWQVKFCDESVARLAPVPFLGIAGNHDIGYHTHNFAVWQERPFVISLPEENKYDGGKCVSGLFRSGETEIIIVGLSYGMRADANALAWARAQFAAHPDALGILFCHELLTDRGQYLLGYPVLEEVVAKSPNVRLILCGHSHTILRTAFTFDDDKDGTDERTVNTLLFDYQSEWNDKLGYMVLLTFDPSDRCLSVISYSPSLDDYICHDDAADRECFVLEDAF